jgi:hypothetical protein
VGAAARDGVQLAGGAAVAGALAPAGDDAALAGAQRGELPAHDAFAAQTDDLLSRCRAGRAPPLGRPTRLHQRLPTGRGDCGAPWGGHRRYSNLSGPVTPGTGSSLPSVCREPGHFGSGVRQRGVPFMDERTSAGAESRPGPAPRTYMSVESLGAAVNPRGRTFRPARSRVHSASCVRPSARPAFDRP